MIPKRPPWTKMPDGSWEGGDLFETIRHEHAVAVLAVEALKEIYAADDRWGAFVISALNDIAASGWKE